MNLYQMVINNTARHLRSTENMAAEQPLNAFEASTYLAVAFCKTKDVLEDILLVDPSESGV